MDCGKSGALIRALRKEKGMTQKTLAGRMGVQDKTISKWETGRGCPDLSLLPELSGLLGVGPEQILSGELHTNQRDGGNMKRVKFYRCGCCGNLLNATGVAEISCCGRKLAPMEVQKADEAHRVKREEMDGELYISFPHPMTKAHFIAFVACVSVERVLLVRLYPEQGGELRIPQIRGGEKLYTCCTEHGLFVQE